MGDIEAPKAWASTFDNARRLKELTAKLQIATVHAVEQAEGWDDTTPSVTAALAAKRRSTPNPSP
jgi:hypothetical protein